jgi:antirestriction protein ArdC
VTYTYAGQEIKTVEIDCGVFENELKRGSVKGKKFDPSDEPLENALFGLFKADETEFTEANALMTATSDDKGNFAFDGIVYGSYVVREIKAPDGYKLSDKKHDVTISKDEQIIEIKAENESIDVDVSKQDVYGNELPGAKMQLVDKNGNVIDKWKSTKKKHTVTKLKAGDYVLKETAAPTGYVIATEIAFSVDEYGKVTVNGVEATASDESGNPTIVMVDDTTKASITKTDISGDKEIEGAEMKLFDKDGNLRYRCEESFPVFKYLPYVKDKDGNIITLEQYDALTDEEKEGYKMRFNLRVYPVWNIDQTDFKELYPDAYKAMTDVPEHEYTEMARDEALERMITMGGWICPILFGGNSAYFSPREKHIRLPKRETFLGDALFYATAIHEMAHSTKIELKRSEEITSDVLSGDKYAYEELVAELTSAVVCSTLGIGKLLDKQHLTYVAGWRKRLRDDKDFIVKVIDDVQKATNFILRVYEENRKAVTVRVAA